MVEGVEGFSAELEVSTLCDVEGLVERGREVDAARTYEAISSAVSEAEVGAIEITGYRRSLWVGSAICCGSAEPVAHLAMVLDFAHDVGPVGVATTQSDGIGDATKSGREGKTGLVDEGTG